MKNSGDVITSILAADAIRNENRNAKVELFIPYFPAARQDRRMVSGEPFSAGVYANILKVGKFDNIYVFDAHSDVTLAVNENITSIDNVDFVKTVWDLIAQNNSNMVLVSPDAGAEKKIWKAAVALNISDEQVVRGSKFRNVKTGRITKTEIIGDVNGKTCVIVDDICDGGMTFIALSEVLKTHGAAKIYLAVSHGIFSKGVDVLKPNICGVYTTNSIYTQTDNTFVTTIPIKYGDIETLI